MKKFGELGIQIDNGSFVGKKKDMEDVIGQPIEVHDYKIVPSKFKEKAYDRCLWMQIIMDGKKCVVFSGSKNLVLQIEAVGKENLPIMTTIVKEDKKLVFT